LNKPAIDKVLISGNKTSYRVPYGKLIKGHKYYWDLATVDTNGNVVNWADRSNSLYFEIKTDDKKPDLEVRAEDIKRLIL
jgi:hypothetical protein